MRAVACPDRTHHVSAIHVAVDDLDAFLAALRPPT